MVLMDSTVLRTSLKTSLKIKGKINGFERFILNYTGK